MQGQIIRLVSGCALLLLSLGIALGGGAPVAAGGLPQMATFKTAHLRIDGSLKASSPAENEEITITGQGEGDVDTARNASQGKFALAYASKAEGKSERETLEMVVVDGRTYWYDPQAKQWVWVDNGPGSGGATLSPAFDDPKQFGADQFAFMRVGPEVIDGAPTTHWHADLDYGKLLDPDGKSAAGAGATTMLATMDLWIGDADSYLHRFTFALQFSAPDQSGQTSTAAGSLTMTYSNFDAPVRIVPPAGAVPMSSGTSALPDGVSSSLSTLSGFSLGMSSLNTAGGTTGSAGSTGSALPVPSSNRAIGTDGSAAVVTPRAVAAANTPTPTKAPATATVAAPTATPASVAAVVPTSAPAAQAAPAVAAVPGTAAPASAGPPKALIAAGIVLLLAGAGALVALGSRSRSAPGRGR
jgi:hypothetical protein